MRACKTRKEITMKKTDLQFVLNTLQDIKPGRSNLDWYAILGYLECNKIGVVFLNKVRNLKLEIPNTVLRHLVNLERVQALRNQYMQKWIEAVSEELRFEKIPHAFLKGSVLSNVNFRVFNVDWLAYGLFPAKWIEKVMESHDLLYEEGERVFNDIDILVHPRDLGGVDKTLKNLGFKQGYWDFKKNTLVPFSRAEILSRRMNRGETAPYFLKIENDNLGFVEVDVNFSLDALPAGNKETLESMLDNIHYYEGMIGKNLSSLSPEHFFLHLLMHQYKEATVYSMVLRQKENALYKYYDIYLFIKNRLFEEAKFVQQTLAAGLSKEAFYVLHKTGQIFPSLNLSPLLEKLRPANTGYLNEVTDQENGFALYKMELPFPDALCNFNNEKYLRKVEKHEE